MQLHATCAHMGKGADSVCARKMGTKERQRKNCLALIVSNFLSHSFHCFIINQFIVRGSAGSERTQWFSGCAYYFYGRTATSRMSGTAESFTMIQLHFAAVWSCNQWKSFVYGQSHWNAFENKCSISIVCYHRSSFRLEASM